MPRFYTSSLLASHAPGNVVQLAEGEAHHLLHVLRLKQGDALELFDGTGWSCSAAIHRVTRRTVDAILESPPVLQAKDPLEVTLAVAAPKQDRLRWLIEKGVELGVARVIPLVTRRSTVTPSAGAIGKLEDAVIQACKQCRRNDALVIDPPCDWTQLLERVRADSTTNVLLGDPRGVPAVELLLGGDRVVRGKWLVIVGPEGGLTDEETREAVQAGAQPACWGNHVLRIETAAIAAAALLRGLASAFPESGGRRPLIPSSVDG